jgi:cytochrome c oxidase subunit 2
MLPMILADGTKSSLWLPRSASQVAPQIDGLFNFVLFINVFFVALVTVLLVVFVLKYRHRPGHTDHTTTAGHSTALELTWTIIPLIIVLIIYLLGFQGYMHLTDPPESAYQITATGHMWNWSFTYPNGHVDPDLHVPRGVPVMITLQSQDVIHDLFIPVLRVKKDAVPDRWNQMWFTATDDGLYDVYCAAYCGRGHSQMRASCYVQEPAAFDAWLKDASVWVGKISPADRGKQLYSDMGCKQCHTVDGSASTGPTWKDLYGYQQPEAQGPSPQLVNLKYVTMVVNDPTTAHVPQFEGHNVMPSFKGQLPPEDVSAIVAYMMTLSKYATPAELKAATTVTPPTAVPTTQSAPIPQATPIVPPPNLK